jgi:hypothetical protein
MMALVGNLISAGAGSNELRDNAIASSQMGRMMKATAFAPFSATRSAINFGRDVKNQGLGTAVGRRLGLRTSRDYQLEEARLNAGGKGRGSSGAGNNKPAGGGGKGETVKKVLEGAGKGVGEAAKGLGQGVGGAIGGAAAGASNVNNNVQPGGNMVNNAVNNALEGKKGDDKK